MHTAHSGMHILFEGQLTVRGGGATQPRFFFPPQIEEQLRLYIYIYIYIYIYMYIYIYIIYIYI